MNESLEQKIALLPEHPGVYKMFDAGGEVIYVGKAINLKNRVRQYFRSQNGMQPKVVAMVSHTSISPIYGSICGRISPHSPW